MKIKGHTIKGHITTSSVSKNQIKGRIPTYTSSTEFTTSKKEHMSIPSSQITPSNMLLLTKRNS